MYFATGLFHFVFVSPFVLEFSKLSGGKDPSKVIDSSALGSDLATCFLFSFITNETGRGNQRLIAKEKACLLREEGGLRSLDYQTSPRKLPFNSQGKEAWKERRNKHISSSSPS